jgi:L-asparaginase II
LTVAGDVAVGGTIRSGLVESTHPWSGVVVTDSGDVLERWGDIDEPLYYRSAIKPLQATASLEAGVDLPPEHVALACASHSATEAHVAIVRRILADGGLDESALQCPPSRPMSAPARDRVAAGGGGAARILHNCSGKHATFLRACVAAGWPLDTYLDPGHPLQVRIADLVAEMTGIAVDPVGVDGCGAPTLRGTIRGLATGFARITVDPRHRAVATAMGRYPALTSGNVRPDGRIAMWWDGPAKGGAEGLMVAARHGVGIATKSHQGSIPVAAMALIEIAARCGMLSSTALDSLRPVRTPPVMGGGRRVGVVVPDLDSIPAGILDGRP